jgi:hypothetical protein
LLSPSRPPIWPSSDAPIQDFDVVLDATGTVIEVDYQAQKDLGGVPFDMGHYRRCSSARSTRSERFTAAGE